jgi:hypothetical protein
MNPRFLATTIVNFAIAAKAGSMIKNTVVDHTPLDEDGLPAKTIEGASTALIGIQLFPHTEKAVDTVTAKINQFRMNRALKNVKD